MGIYDRDYYRESSGQWWAGFGGRSITFWLILINCVAFGFQLLTAPVPGAIGVDLLAGWGQFDAAAILDGQVWRLLTSHFLHGGIWHLLFNMLILYFVGRELEAIYSPREFLTFYLTIAILISLGKLALAAADVTRPDAVSLGASGPVTASFILFAFHFPYRTVLLFFIIPVPVWLMAVGIVALDMLGFLGMGKAGVGYVAHLLGALFAYLYFRYQWRLSSWLDLVPGRLSSLTRRRGSRPRLYTGANEDSEPVGAAMTGGSPTAVEGRTQRRVDEQLEAKIDHVLEKVSRYGRESLTAEEQNLLLRASEIYKQKRGL